MKNYCKYTHTFEMCFRVQSDHRSPDECLTREKQEVINALQKRIRDVFTDTEYIDAIVCIDTVEQLEFNL